MINAGKYIYTDNNIYMLEQTHCIAGFIFIFIVKISVFTYKDQLFDCHVFIPQYLVHLLCDISTIFHINNCLFTA